MKNFVEYKSFATFGHAVRTFFRKNVPTGTKLNVRSKENFIEVLLTFSKPVREMTTVPERGVANFPLNNVLASKQAGLALLELIPELKETDLIFMATGEWTDTSLTAHIFSPIARKNFKVGDEVTLLPIANLPGGKMLPANCEKGFQSSYVERPARYGRRRLRGYASDIGVYMYDRVSLSNYRFTVCAIHPGYYSLISSSSPYNEEIQISENGSNEWSPMEKRNLYEDSEWFIPDYAISSELNEIPLELRNSVSGRFVEVPAAEGSIRRETTRRISPVTIQSFADVFQKFAER